MADAAATREEAQATQAQCAASEAPDAAGTKQNDTSDDGETLLAELVNLMDEPFERNMTDVWQQVFCFGGEHFLIKCFKHLKEISHPVRIPAEGQRLKMRSWPISKVSLLLLFPQIKAL